MTRHPKYLLFVFYYSVGTAEPVLRSGESIKAAVQSLSSYVRPNGPIEAFLFNCSSPDVITAALPIMEREIKNLKLKAKSGAYANGFVQIFDANKNASATETSDSKGKH